MSVKKIYFLVFLLVFKTSAMELPQEENKTPMYDEFSLKELEEKKVSALQAIQRELVEINKTLRETDHYTSIREITKNLVVIGVGFSLAIILGYKL